DKLSTGRAWREQSQAEQANGQGRQERGDGPEVADGDRERQDKSTGNGPPAPLGPLGPPQTQRHDRNQRKGVEQRGCPRLSSGTHRRRASSITIVRRRTNSIVLGGGKQGPLHLGRNPRWPPLIAGQAAWCWPHSAK